MLTVDIEKTFGEFSLAGRFTAEGGCTVLFGPSGAGKTTIIAMIAGLTRPDRGRIVLDGEPLFDSKARIDVPASQRHIGTVFQEGRLFPHLSVKHNLDYGRWMNGHAFDAAAFERVVDAARHRPSADAPARPAVGRRAPAGGDRPRAVDAAAAAAARRAAGLARRRAQSEILPYLERLRDEARVPMIYVSHWPKR